MILVTGAAGKTGLALIHALQQRQASMRALVYRPQQAADLRQLGVRDIEIGNMAEASTYARAAHGASAVYHICPNMHPDEVAIGKTAIDAAREAGCKRFVYHSVLHPQTESMLHHWNKLQVEARLFESGLEFTILQPGPYMQNLLAGWDTIRNEGIFEVPYSTSARFSLVDLRDVAEAAAVVLTQPGHEGATYELCGPERLSSLDAAEAFAWNLGRPVQAKSLALPEWRRRAESSGLSAYALSTLQSMFRYYDQHGLWGGSRVLTSLLGRQPVPFAAFLERHVS